MKTTIWVIVIVVLVFSTSYFYCKNNILKHEITIKNDYLSTTVVELNSIEYNYEQNIQNVNLIINKSIATTDTSGTIVTLSVIAHKSDDNFLICRYSERMCRECVEHAISVIINNSNYFDFNKIIFIANNSSRRVFKLNISEFGLQNCQVLNCANLGIQAENEMFPYFLFVDREFRVLNVYYPNKSTHGSDFDFKHVKMLYDKFIKE